MLERVFEVLDANGDGRVSRAELAFLVAMGDSEAGALRAVFLVLDRDGNGSLSADEVAVFVTSLVLAVVFSAERLRSAIAQTRR